MAVMTPAGLDLNLLLAFEALMETRSVTRAAQRLGLRQPAMSAALARLRAAFGDDLFVRAGATMQPTPKALRLAEGVQGALALLRAVFEEADSFDPAVSRRTFTVASADYVAFVLLPALFPLLLAQAPGVNLRVVGYDKMRLGETLDGGGVDACLGTFADPPPRALRRPLWRERFVGVARRHHPAIAAGPMTVEAYAGLGHVLMTLGRDGAGAVDEALAGVGLKRRVALTVPHFLGVREVILRSDLVSAMPERLASRLAEDGVLALFEIPLPLEPWRVDMLSPEATRRDAASLWLRERIAEAADRSAGLL